MNNIVVTTPERLTALLRETVREAVGQALRDLAKKTPVCMDETQAAEYMGLAPATLRQWRSQKKGPKYHKTGRTVRYSREDLDAYLRQSQILTIDSLEARHEKSC